MKGRERQADLTLRIRPAELRTTAPAGLREDQFVAQLGSAALGSTSYVVGRRDPRAPEWIVLGYATGSHERVWRHTRTDADGALVYALVEDDSSNGYVSVA